MTDPTHPIDPKPAVDPIDPPAADRTAAPVPAATADRSEPAQATGPATPPAPGDDLGRPPAPAATTTSRRRFLVGAGVATVATVAGAAAWQRMVADRVARGPVAAGTAPGTSAVAPGQRDTVLVLVQLSGGNDALNTLPPADGRYLDARPTLGVPEADRVALAGTTAHALHPSLAPLAPLWADRRLAALADIGFAGQSRSHFQALDTWWTARPDELTSPGWLGRWLDATAAADPANPLRAVALGGGAPALTGTSSLVTVVQEPDQLRLLAPPGADPEVLTAALLATARPLADEPLLAAAQAAMPTTLTALERLQPVVAPGAAAAAGRAGAGSAAEGRLGSLLRTAAAVLELDLGTRVVQVSASGFDTHADQAVTHPRLLADLADGLTAVVDAVAAQGRGGQVLVVAVSEFGRRVAENGSGTDHGAGGLALVAGDPVRAGAVGGQVVGAMDLGALVQGDLPLVLDARSLYAACLDHLGGLSREGADPSLTDEVLGGTHDRLGLLA